MVNSLYMTIFLHVQANTFDIITKIKERFHNELNKQFAEIGVLFGQNRNAADTRVESVIGCLRSNSRAADSFLKIVTVLTGQEHMEIVQVHGASRV